MTKSEKLAPGDYDLNRAKTAVKRLREFLYGFECEPDMVLLYKGEPLEINRVCLKQWIHLM